MNITENFLELIDIEDIILEEEYVNMGRRANLPIWTT
jgi:hypothetical protein